jgi:hypothetical protein
LTLSRTSPRSPAGMRSASGEGASAVNGGGGVGWGGRGGVGGRRQSSMPPPSAAAVGRGGVDPLMLDTVHSVRTRNVCVSE